MRLPRNQQLTSLFCLVILCLGTLSGCRSGMFASKPTEWRRPDLSRMAFWRKEADEMPLPPALHFDPTPAGGTSIAKQTDTNVDQLARKSEPAADVVDLKPATQRPIGSQSKALEDLNHLAENLKDKPVRNPYQVSSSNNDIPGALDPNRDFQVEKARQDFIAAMNGNQPAASAEAAADSVSGQSPKAPPRNPLFSPYSAANENVAQNGLQGQNRTAEQQSVHSEMAVAQQEINQLRTELSQRSLQPISAETVPVSPKLAGSSSSTDRDFQPLQPVSSNSTEGAVTRVAQLDGNWPSSGGHQSASAEAKTFSPSSSNSLADGDRVAQYPSTNHGGFFSPSNDPSKLDRPDPIRPANLQREIQQFSGTGSSSEFPSNRVKNFSADVDVPEAVLQRQGSFAPGSLQPLKNFY